MGHTTRSLSRSATSALRYPDYLTCPPSVGTLRNFDNPTYGPRIAKVFRLLTGQMPMPHQQYIFDVFGEVHPDGPRRGLRVYREGLIDLSRQQGKTEMVRTFKVHRPLEDGKRDPQTLLFAAQSGDDSKAIWLKHCEAIMRSPLAPLVKATKPEQPTTTNGKELFSWANGSTERPISSRPTSGHGTTLHFGTLTEAFAQVDYRVEQTMLFAMRAVMDAQFLAESAAGTAMSIYWNERMAAETERLLAEPDAPSRVAVFRWFVDPVADDPTLPATWAKATPALGYTITQDQLQHDFETANTPGKWRAFMRGALNIPDLGAATGSIIAEEDVEACTDAASRIGDTPAVALDIANDRSWAAIGMAGESVAGFNHVGLVAYERGTHWVINHLVNVMHVDTVAVATGSQAAAMAPQLEAAGLTVVIMSTADVTAACAGIYDDIVDHQLRLVPGQSALLAAIAGAVWTAGDARKFSRANSTVDIAPLYAVTLARHLHFIESREPAYDPLAHIF